MSWHWHKLGDSSQPVLVFLHGFMGTGADWVQIASSFSDHFYCMMPDLPGHGETPLDDGLGYTAWSISLRDELSAQWIERIHLVGYSMGGRLALYFSLRYPEMVEKLVLESANPGIVDKIKRKERAALDDKLAARIREQGMKEFLEFWYNIPLFESLNHHPDVKAQLIEKRSQQNGENMARVLSEMSLGRQPELWSRLGELEMPTLLVAGELDEKYCHITSQMAATLSKSTRVTLPDCGHNAHLENRSLFFCHLGSWVR